MRHQRGYALEIAGLDCRLELRHLVRGCHLSHNLLPARRRYLCHKIACSRRIQWENHDVPRIMMVNTALRLWFEDAMTGGLLQRLPCIDR